MIVLADFSNYNLPSVKNIFSSIKFIQPPVKKWSQFTDDKKRITAWLPGAMRELPENFYSNNQLLGFDTTTATSYFIKFDTLNKYKWYASVDDVYKDMTTETANLEKIYIKDIKSGKLKGKESLHKSATNHDLYERTRMVVSDSIIYTLSVSGEKN